MKRGNTRYYSIFNKTPILKLVMEVIYGIMLCCAFGYLLIYFFTSKDMDIKFRLVGLIFSLLVLTFIISLIISILVAKFKVLKLEKKKNHDAYSDLYFRELPNNFGIGVATLLFNSQIENEKDVVAIILDLCARKYISLEKLQNKYIVRVLKPIDSRLLTNEKYILSLLINNNLNDINFNEWFNYCMADGVQLGLYTHNEQYEYYHANNVGINKLDFWKLWRKSQKIILIILAIAFGYLLINYLNKFSLIIFIIKSFFQLLFLYCILNFGLFLISYVLSFGKVFISSIKSQYEESKKYFMNNLMSKTEKGVKEFQKLKSFKNFLIDFGNFDEKQISDIILWDRYLSYAQVFGITDKIMKLGYSQIINNDSFKIDSIDNVKLDNIEVIDNK